MDTIVSTFADLCQAEPARPLIHVAASGRTVTASDIWAAHVTLADRLSELGVGRGHLVLSAAGNSSAAPALLLACRELDAVMMPLDPGATAAEIDTLSARFDAAAIATADSMRPLSLAGRKYPGVAVLKLTSGSTGLSKATRTSEAQLVADCVHIVRAMDIRDRDTQIAVIPLSHSYGLGNLLLPMLLQGTACVLRETFVPQLLPSDARRFGARIFPGVPFMFQYFLDHPPADEWPPALARLISAGAPLLPDTLRSFYARFGRKIHSFYGASETGGIAFDGDDEIDNGGAVGRPLPGVTLTFRGDDCEDPGSSSDGKRTAGRIHVRSDAVSLGYVEEDGDEAFADGGFLTGDYGAIDACGRLTLRGRVSSFVNVAGRKVQPEEVEAVLRTMPGVADVRVVSAPDAQRGQQIVACIVAGAAAAITALSMRRFCAGRLAPYKIPRVVVFVDAIPLTSRGKTDRAALDALVRARLR